MECGLTEDGKIMIADSNGFNWSKEKCYDNRGNLVGGWKEDNYAYFDPSYFEKGLPPNTVATYFVIEVKDTDIFKGKNKKESLLNEIINNGNVKYEWLNEAQHNVIKTVEGLHEKWSSEGWTYGHYGKSGLLYGDYTFEDIINSPNKTLVCATDVACTLYRNGYVTEEDFTFPDSKGNPCFNPHNPSAVVRVATNKGWQKITNKDDLKPGDLIAYYEKGTCKHVDFYAGGNLFWTAGSTEGIQATEPVDKGENWEHIRKWEGYRLPELNKTETEDTNIELTSEQKEWEEKLDQMIGKLKSGKNTIN